MSADPALAPFIEVLPIGHLLPQRPGRLAGRPGRHPADHRHRARRHRQAAGPRPDPGCGRGGLAAPRRSEPTARGDPCRPAGVPRRSTELSRDQRTPARPTGPAASRVEARPRAATIPDLGPLPWIGPALLLIFGVVLWPAIEMLRTSLSDISISGAQPRVRRPRQLPAAPRQPGAAGILVRTITWVVVVVERHDRHLAGPRGAC